MMEGETMHIHAYMACIYMHIWRLIIDVPDAVFSVESSRTLASSGDLEAGVARPLAVGEREEPRAELAGERDEEDED